MRDHRDCFSGGGGEGVVGRVVAPYELERTVPGRGEETRRGVEVPATGRRVVGMVTVVCMGGETAPIACGLSREDDQTDF